MPGWFGGSSSASGGSGGAGTITLPPPGRGVHREWGNVAGGAQHGNASYWGQQWPQGLAGGSDVSLVGGSYSEGGAAAAGKVINAAQTRMPAFRTANGVGGGGGGVGAQQLAGSSAGSRRPARGGSEFDFVWELGMLLEEDEFSADAYNRVAVGQYGR